MLSPVPVYPRVCGPSNPEPFMFLPISLKVITEWNIAFSLALSYLVGSYKPKGEKVMEVKNPSVALLTS